MKYPTILSMALIAVLMVLAVSCTPLQSAQGDYEERPSSARRVYVDDPYYRNNTVYLVRDPYTGMYYEVRPYGYSPYGSSYGNDYYYYNDRNRYYRNYPSRGSSGSTNRPPSENTKKSRGTVLGKN